MVNCPGGNEGKLEPRSSRGRGRDGSDCNSEGTQDLQSNWNNVFDHTTMDYFCKLRTTLPRCGWWGPRCLCLPMSRLPGRGAPDISCQPEWSAIIWIPDVWSHLEGFQAPHLRSKWSRCCSWPGGGRVHLWVFWEGGCDQGRYDRMTCLWWWWIGDGGVE